MFTTWLYTAITLPIIAFISTCWAYIGKKEISPRMAISNGLVLVITSGTCFLMLGVPSFMKMVASIDHSLPADLALQKQIVDVVIWLLPFVTAAIGTNLISDVLTRGIKYKKRPSKSKEQFKMLRAVIKTKAKQRRSLIDQRKSSRRGQQVLRSRASWGTRGKVRTAG